MVNVEAAIEIAAPVERCFDLARSVDVHLVENRHCGEPALALAGVKGGLVGLSERVTWRARHFGFRHTLTSEITAMDRPRYFQETMVDGAFRCMHHDHFFRGTARGTEMRNVLCFAAPLGLLGRIAEVAVLRCYMEALLLERNRVVKQLAESDDWRRYLVNA